jgi:hypothetical protein
MCLAECSVCLADLGSELSRVVSNYQFALSDPSDVNAVTDATCVVDNCKQVEYEIELSSIFLVNCGSLYFLATSLFTFNSFALPFCIYFR